jgi:hypothetical protein
MSISNKKNDDNNYQGFLIYKLTSPRKKVYIGATTNLRKRLQAYRYNNGSINNQKSISKQLKEENIDKWEISILYRHPANQKINIKLLNSLEQDYIYDEYLKNEDNLLNIVIRGTDWACRGGKSYKKVSGQEEG